MDDNVPFCQALTWNRFSTFWRLRNDLIPPFYSIGSSSILNGVLRGFVVPIVIRALFKCLEERSYTHDFQNSAQGQGGPTGFYSGNGSI